MGCTGRHSLDLLALHNKSQRYHLEVEGIPEYINILEDSKNQAGAFRLLSFALLALLALGVLEHIYILGDVLDLEVIALHFVVQRQKVEGGTSRVPRLEMRK